MINWAELDEDFQAFAKDLQSRYDGKGSFLSPEEAARRNEDSAGNAGEGNADSADNAAEKDASTAAEDASAMVEWSVFSKLELTVALGKPSSPNEGLPVRFDISDGAKTGWAIGWLPTCAVSCSEGLGENELAFVGAYLRDNAAALLDGFLKEQQ